MEYIYPLLVLVAGLIIGGIHLFVEEWKKQNEQSKKSKDRTTKG